MTAITQYGIHRFFLQEYPEAENAYKYIAAAEIIHWNLLGGLIKDLGLCPKFLSYETKQPWNGCFPAYHTNFKEIISSDYEGEQAAIAHYKRMIDYIDDAAIQSLFQRIILDEEMHIEILTDLYRRYK